MESVMRCASIFLAAILLAGCWRSETSLYTDDTPLTPFRPGPMKVLDSDGKVTHEVFTLQDGTYHLRTVGSDNVVNLRFFSLPDAPAGIYVFEAAFLPTCKVVGSCEAAKVDTSRYYGLAHVTEAGVEELMGGDCNAQTVKDLGAVGIDGLNNCEFSNRATLEKALQTLIGTKPVSVTSPE
jgi:hypothetical protein